VIIWEKYPYFQNGVQLLYYNFSDPAKATGTPGEVMQPFVNDKRGSSEGLLRAIY